MPENKSKLNYAVFTFSGEGLSVAERLQREGNLVIVGMITSERDTCLETEKDSYHGEDPKKKPRRLAMYDGILKKYSAKDLVKYFKDLPKEERKNWFLFFDFNHCFHFAEQLSGEGYYGNFPTSTDRKFEQDREFAKNFVKQHYPDIKVAEEHKFKTVIEAIAFMKETQNIFVLKGFDDSAETVVPDTEDPEEAKNQIINALQDNKQKYEKGGFILEQKIPHIIEVTPEIHFYNGQVIGATCDLENKQIGAGNLSFMTGCAADCVFPIDLESKLAKIAFPTAVYALAKLHKGWFIWDLSILFDKRTGTPYMGEFCPNRPGYNSFLTDLTILDSASKFFEAIVKSKNPFPRSGFATSLRMFDFEKDSKTLLAKIGKKFTFSEETFKNLWMWDVKKDDKDYVTSGYNYNNAYSDVAVITGSGKSIEESAHNMYESVEGFNYKGIYYRPEFDYISKDYSSSILNRYKYLIDKKLL